MIATESVVCTVRDVAAAVKLDEEVALKKAATTDKMQDAATELALHEAYLTLTYSSCRIPQHIKWKHSVHIHSAGYARYISGIRARLYRGCRGWWTALNPRYCGRFLIPKLDELAVPVSRQLFRLLLPLSHKPQWPASRSFPIRPSKGLRHRVCSLEVCRSKSIPQLFISVFCSRGIGEVWIVTGHRCD